MADDAHTGSASDRGSGTVSNVQPRRERWRPRVHFTPHRHWVNDPNGLVWFDGEYHVFYQHNPVGNVWGHMSWGHAVSPDLLHWTELPVAIAETEQVSIFSGSVVVDEHNSSGLAAGGGPVLVAIYTGCSRRPEGGQSQHLAFSTDRGRTWQQHAGNPVLDIGARDFRDPKVFWHVATQAWVMVVVLPDERAALFYRSADLKRWHPSGRFEAPFVGQGIWECPDLIPLPMASQAEPVWLFKVDVFGGHPSGGTGARWFCGRFDGQVFHAGDTASGAGHGPAHVDWADWGADFYAALSWAHLPAPAPGQPPRALWLAWMNCHRYAAALPTNPWRGGMTLPRELALRREAGRWLLLQQPAPELQALRGAAFGATGLVVPAGGEAELTRGLVAAEVQLRLHAPDETTRHMPPDASHRCGLRLHSARGEWLELGWDAQAGAVYVDRGRAGFVPPGDTLFATRRLAPVAKRPRLLHVWFDAASVEVFVDDGHTVLTEQFFPQGDEGRLCLFNAGGPAGLGDVQGWHLHAARFA